MQRFAGGIREKKMCYKVSFNPESNAHVRCHATALICVCGEFYWRMARDAAPRRRYKLFCHLASGFHQSALSHKLLKALHLDSHSRTTCNSHILK
jgi:hypothetical protein